MKSFLGPLLVSLSTLAVAAQVNAADAPASAAARVFALGAQNGSGETGTVALIAQGEKTTVEIALVGAAAGLVQPAHIHLGSCAKLDPKPKYALTSIKDGVSTSIVDVPLATLVAGGMAVNVHKSGDEIKTYVACGDLAKS